jgi:excinuclease UvrABC nuclease subunit
MTTRWQKYDLMSILVAPRKAGCYAVYLDGRLAYIGQAKSMRDRICNGHCINYARYSAGVVTPWGRAKSATFKLREVPNYKIRLALELRLIKRLSPVCNVAGRKDLGVFHSR